MNWNSWISTCLVLVMSMAVGGCGTDGGDPASGDTLVSDGSSDVADPDVAEPDGEVLPDEGIAEDLEAEEKTPREYRPVVFAITSDIHVDGPFESSTPQRVVALFQKTAILEPTPEFIVITGDLIDNLEEPVATGEGSVMNALVKVLESSPIPVEPVMGNHDYYAKGDAIFALTSDFPARTALYEEQIGLPPFHHVVHGGINFVYLNSMLGPRCADSIGLNGSLGAEQLAWLDQLLSDGEPALLFLHHPPSTVLEEGDVTLETLVSKHRKNVMAVFAGHIHVWGRSDIDGVPVYLTKEGFRGQHYQHLRVDPVAGTIDLLNAEDIDFGETVEVPCEADVAEPLQNPSALDGSVLLIQIPDGNIAPMGLGSYLKEMMPDIPLAIRLLQLDHTGTLFQGLITIGKTSGSATAEAPAYMTSVWQGTCVPMEVTLDGPCMTTNSIDLTINIAGMVGIPLPPGWQLRGEFRNLTLSGLLTDEASIEFGVLRSVIDFNPGAEDIRSIIVTEYCGSRLVGCTPGQGGLPACPDPVDSSFFDSIPMDCDVDLLGIGMRSVFAIFNSVPGLTLQLDANFFTFHAEESDTARPGAYSPKLFAPAPDGNCPASAR
jgi:hypothetical protein